MSYKPEKSALEKSTGVITVIVFHLVIIYALAVGLNHDPMDIIKQQIDAKIIEEEAPPPDEAPPPPPPEFVPPPPDFVPPPDIEFTADAAPTNTNAITVSTKPVVEAPKATPPRVPKKGLSRPPYPSSSLRLGEEGLVGLSLSLGADGKVLDGKVAVSSGFERLDTAALKHAIRSWKFEPCMSGDKPIACSYRMNFRFKISDEKGR